MHEIRINYGLMREEDYAVLHDPNARPVIDLHEQTSIETNDQSGLIFVNKYRTGGRFGWHIDQEPYSDADDSLIVNTHGTARIGLKHADGAKCLYDLKPGDAVYIDNSGPSHFRPSHTIWNTTIGTRIAIVD
ncbi:hypothetical protein KC973_02490 [Candidatus Saccharibacteria bacterium]|nr:hypothetical protein [Candidatus Saccharibacteria bacterium]